MELRALKLKCVRNTGDQWGTSDDIYWVSGAGSDLGYKKSYRSQEFSGLWSGYEASFPAGTTLFGSGVGGSLLVNIECWERDQGGIFDELQKQMVKIAQACADAAVSIVEHGESEEAGLAAVIAVVAAMIAWLLGWLTNDDDDFVGERSIAFSYKALAHRAQASDAAPSDADAASSYTWDFASSEGHYRLFTQVAEVPFDDRSPYRRTWDPTNGWSEEQILPQSLIAREQPTVNVVGDTIYLSHFDEVGRMVHERTFNGTTWSPYREISNATAARSAGATIGARRFWSWPMNGVSSGQQLGTFSSP